MEVEPILGNLVKMFSPSTPWLFNNRFPRISEWFGTIREGEDCGWCVIHRETYPQHLLNFPWSLPDAFKIATSDNF